MERYCLLKHTYLYVKVARLTDENHILLPTGSENSPTLHHFKRCIVLKAQHRRCNLFCMTGPLLMR